MIPLTIIGGYLGAGKTTLLNHLLRANDGQRLALIINDFGALNIDADLIESRSDDQINLTNGCICCGMSDGFDEALEQLLEIQPAPDHIVVEASGVADVGVLARYGHLPGLRANGVVLLIDAPQIHRQVNDRFVGPTVRRQLRAADLAVLNKTDLLAEDERGTLREQMTQWECTGRIVEATRGQLPIEVVLGAGSSESTTLDSVPDDKFETREKPAIPRPDLSPENEHSTHDHHPAYDSWSFTRTGSLSRAQIDAFVEALPESVLRAKGTLLIDGNPWQLQVVGPRKELAPLVTERPDHTEDATGVALSGCRLVAIGLSHNFNAADLEEAAALLQRA